MIFNINSNLFNIASIVWDASPEIFSIGPIHIRWYGLLFALSFVAGYQILYWIFRLEDKPQKELEALTITVIIGTVLGARLGHCLLYEPEYYLSRPLEILMVWHGGLASHGAAFGIILSIYYYSKRKSELSLSWIFDRMTIVIALAATFIRIGNFFNSEILGHPTDIPWAVVFIKSDGLARHPVQLYEAISYIVLFFILFKIYKNRQASIKSGLLSGIFLTYMFIVRFIIEFFKEEQAAFTLPIPITMGQLLSLPFIIIGIIILIYSLKNKFQNNS